MILELLLLQPSLDSSNNVDDNGDYDNDIDNDDDDDDDDNYNNTLYLLWNQSSNHRYKIYLHCPHIVDRFQTALDPMVVFGPCAPR